MIYRTFTYGNGKYSYIAAFSSALDAIRIGRGFTKQGDKGFYVLSYDTVSSAEPFLYWAENIDAGTVDSLMVRPTHLHSKVVGVCSTDKETNLPEVTRFELMEIE